MIPRLLRAAPFALVIAAGLAVGAHRLAARTPAATTAPACSGGATGACSVAAADADPDAPVDLPAGKPRLLEFESAHCTACARMAPVVKEIEARCAGEPDTVLRVRVDEPRGEALAARYGVRAVPTFVNVDAEGIEVERSVGEQSRERIARMLGEVRGLDCTKL